MLFVVRVIMSRPVSFSHVLATAMVLGMPFLMLVRKATTTHPSCKVTFGTIVCISLQPSVASVKLPATLGILFALSKDPPNSERCEGAYKQWKMLADIPCANEYGFTILHHYTLLLVLLHPVWLWLARCCK